MNSIISKFRLFALLLISPLIMLFSVMIVDAADSDRSVSFFPKIRQKNFFLDLSIGTNFDSYSSPIVQIKAYNGTNGSDNGEYENTTITSDNTVYTPSKDQLVNGIDVKLITGINLDSYFKIGGVVQFWKFDHTRASNLEQDKPSGTNTPNFAGDGKKEDQELKMYDYSSLYFGGYVEFAIPTDVGLSPYIFGSIGYSRIKVGLFKGYFDALGSFLAKNTGRTEIAVRERDNMQGEYSGAVTWFAGGGMRFNFGEISSVNLALVLRHIPKIDISRYAIFAPDLTEGEEPYSVTSVIGSKVLLGASIGISFVI